MATPEELMSQVAGLLPATDPMLKKPIDLPSIEEAQLQGDSDSDLENAAVEGEDAPADETQTEETQEEDASEEEGDTSADASTLVKIKDGDEEKEISLADLKSNYIEKTKTEKELKTLKQEFEQVPLKFSQAIQEEAGKYAKALEGFEQWMMAVAGQEFQGLDLDKLAEENPAEHVRVMNKVNKVNGVLQKLQQERQRVSDAQTAETQRVRAAAVAASRKVLNEEIKGFNNEMYHGLLKSAVEYYGFTAQEAGSVIDPRVIKMMHDASQFRQLTSKKTIAEKKVVKTTPVVKPGVVQDNTPKAVKAAKAQKTFMRARTDESAAQYLIEKGLV